jgi:hypothetical protein
MSFRIFNAHSFRERAEPDELECGPRKVPKGAIEMMVANDVFDHLAAARVSLSAAKS